VLSAANHTHAHSAAEARATPVRLAAGTLIALEGPKGAGKTTACTMVAERLAEMGIGDVLVTKEPTGAFNLAQEGTLRGKALAVAISRDRSAHVRDLITPAMQTGNTVLCDRYILSSLVFQGADGVSADQVWQLNMGFPLPDINILITADAESIRERRAARRRLTRLEEGRDPARELEDYLRHAEVMNRRGVEMLCLDNSSPDDLPRVVEAIVELLTKAEPS
jgi:dTMP kinase